MESDRLDELERRIAALESEIEAWRRRARVVLDRKYPDRGQAPGRVSVAARDALRGLADVVTGEGAIGRIGIGLLLLGLVFAVKYGIDRGWITEMVQVGLATLLGLTLLAAGHRLREGHPVLGRLLTGGGFGALYVAVFSAQAVYGLLPAWPALGLASLVTAACFLVGTSRDDASMAIVAVLGGLLTPFVIRAGDTDLPALVAYVAVVFAAAGLLYLRHGWRSLLLWTAASGMTVIVMILVYLNEPEPIPTSWRWSAQGILAVAFLLFTVLPVARAGIARLRPAPGPPDWVPAQLARYTLPVLATVLGLLLWFMGRAVWKLEDVTWAATGLGVALWIMGGWTWVRDPARRPESGALFVLGSVIAAIVFVDLFDGDGLSLAGWTGVLLVGSWAASSRNEAGAWVAAGALAAVVVFWLPDRMAGNRDSAVPFLSWSAAGDVLSLAFLALAARFLPKRWLRLAVGLLVWVFTLWLFSREFTEAWAVTTAWSVFAVVLLASGRAAPVLRLVGMATVILVVLKLLLFDLSRLDELVRVGLFAGFGLVLLVVSYFFPSWWKRPTDAADQSADA